VPIDDLKPILDDLLKFGKPNRPPRPWLGLYATEIEDKIVIVGLASRGPAQAADIHTGDVILAVAGRQVTELSTMFRKVWSLGNAGVDVPLLVYRDGRTFEVTVKSSDRTRFLKGPSLH
jgi:S1-C subfamily serine protease